MPDARLPPEPTQSEDPPRAKGLRLGEADIIAAARLDVLGDGSLKEALAASSPAAIQADRHEQNAIAGPHAQDAGFDDVQPMLDLRFPDPVPGGALQEEPEPTSAAAIPPGSAPEGASQQPLEQHPGGAGGRSQPAAEQAVEVSPIFSALDAAERTSAFGQDPDVAAAPEPPAILLPAQPAFSAARPDAPEPKQHDQPVAEMSVAPPETQPEAAPHQEAAEGTAADHASTAAARIAIEANATAEALENLKRLLNHKLPLVDTTADRTDAGNATEPEDDRQHAAAHSFAPAYAMEAPLEPEPVTPPPMIPLPPAATIAELRNAQPPPRRTGRVVASFLGGFALSWVFGAVLYVYLNMI